MKRFQALFAFALLAGSQFWTPQMYGQNGTNSLTLSPASLSFAATAGSTTVIRKSLTVTDATTVRISVSASGTSGGFTWLSVSPAGTLTTPQTLTVSANPNGLGVATYSGTIHIRYGEGRYVNVPVTLSVSAATRTLTVSPASLSFSATAAGVSPGSQSLSLTASPNSTYTASVSGGSWLRVSPATGTTPATLTVSSSVTGLSAGTFSGSVIVTGNGRTATIPVTFVVNPASTLNVSPSSLSFAATAGGASPGSQSLSLTASPNTTFTASVSGGSWLKVAPSSGTTPATLTVSSSVTGLSAGTFGGTITVTGNGRTVSIPVTLTVNPASTLSVSPTTLSFSATSGGASPGSKSLTLTASPNTPFTASVNSGSWLSVSPATGTTPATLTVNSRVTGLAAGTFSGTITVTGNGHTSIVPVTFTVNASGGGSGGTFKLIGWNDLGMHCFDGKDYSVFGVLPPYNTVHAHLVNTSGSLVTTPGSYKITYQAIKDPLTSTLNTTSIGKTNFWTYMSMLGLGASIPDVGLTGNSMPGSANTPQSMAFSTTDNTWMASGIPITPYADNGTTNYFPMMRLTATDVSGAVLATTDIVLPTSDEMSCAKCHASNSNPAAQPGAGWANDPDPAKDAKLNILRKHDDRFASTAQFQSAAGQVGYNPSGLSATVATTPVLCYNCHASNALNKAGVNGLQSMTSAMHRLHSSVVDPATGATMDSSTSRTTCYSCHPGPKTQCLRGAMGTLQSSTGGNAIECQSCHGNLTAVANPSRSGWLSEPTCQNCHTGLASATNTTLAYTSAFSSGTTLRTPADNTFATNANTPATGLSLYRFSSGHGGMQCEACHGSTHAEFPTPIANDNVQSINLQGHAGTLSECSTCHSTVPSTTNGGPHGLHPIGSSWVSQHQGVADGGGTAACQACHGTDYRGTILSRVKADRTLAGHTFKSGTIIGCYSCHNGPNGG